jgi:thiamine biosynthesis lipoprotein
MLSNQYRTEVIRMNIIRSFKSLGTVNTISVKGEISSSVLDRAQAMVTEMDDRWSVFKDSSEISLINRNAGITPVTVSSDTIELLTFARSISIESHGAFSITIGPLSQVWRKALKSMTLPDQHTVRQIRRLVSDKAIQIDPEMNTVYLPVMGMSIDLGSIAKGYAADQIRDYLKSEGVNEAIINCGGTVCVIGRAQQIGIQHPRMMTGVPFAAVTLCNQSAVTSGDYEQGFDFRGRRYHHIIDARTGEPCRSRLAGVTLTGGSAMLLDALSTAVYVAGIEAGASLIRKRNIECIAITDNMEVICTDNIGKQLRFLPQKKEAKQ